MHDHEWQAAYNAGRESAAGLIEVLERIAVGKNEHGVPDGSPLIAMLARTALEKYRAGQ